MRSRGICGQWKPSGLLSSTYGASGLTVARSGKGWTGRSSPDSASATRCQPCTWSDCQPYRSKAALLKSRMSELDMSGSVEGLGRATSPVYSTIASNFTSQLKDIGQCLQEMLTDNHVVIRFDA